MNASRSVRACIRPAQAGFTLIELMVVVAVLAIITALAVTSYSSSTMKARRGSAQACLAESAQFMERHYTTNMTYAGGDPVLSCETELSDYYTFAFDGTPDATNYKLQATPIGAQLGDTRCGVMTVDQAGVKSAAGSAGAAGCW